MSDPFKILVENSGYHLRNLGDAAMLQVGCDRLAKVFPGATTHVVTTAPGRLATLCPDTEPVPAEWSGAWRAAKLSLLPQRFMSPAKRENELLKAEELRFTAPEEALRKAHAAARVSLRNAPEFERWLNLIKRMDAVVATGGGFLCDAFRDHCLGVLETLRTAQLLGKPTALFAQGIGPATDPVLARRIRAVLRAADSVTFRERAGAEAFYKEHGLEFDPACVTGDDAFDLASRHNALDSGHERLRIGVNLRRASYSGCGSEEMETLGRALRGLRVDEPHEWVPVPVDTTAGEGDMEATLELLGEARPAAPSTPHSPEALSTLAASCNLIVTGSYHAAVFGLAAGVPVCGLVASDYYRGKFGGLAAIFENGVEIVSLTGENLSETLGRAVEWSLATSRNQRQGWRATALEYAAKSQRSYEAFAEAVRNAD